MITNNYNFHSVFVNINVFFADFWLAISLNVKFIVKSMVKCFYLLYNINVRIIF